MKRQMWSNPSSNYDSSLGSPNFPSLNMSKMRAIKNGTGNGAFETSPRLGKVCIKNVQGQEKIAYMNYQNELSILTFRQLHTTE